MYEVVTRTDSKPLSWCRQRYSRSVPQTIYIYAYGDPFDPKGQETLRYVGASSDPENRLEDRYYRCRLRASNPRLKKNTELHRWIWQLREQHGRRPRLFILQEVSYDNDVAWRTARSYWIDELTRRGHPLFNKEKNAGVGHVHYPEEWRSRQLEKSRAAVRGSQTTRRASFVADVARRKAQRGVTSSSVASSDNSLSPGEDQ